MHMYSIDPFASRSLQTFEELTEIGLTSLRQIMSEKYRNDRYFRHVLDVLQHVT